MSTITHAGTTYNTTAGNKTVVATPAVGDLIVIIAASTGVTTSNVTDNNADGKGTYTQVDVTRTGFSTTGNLTVWIRNALVGSATSTTFTAAQASSTGGGLSVFRADSMSRTGALAARSTGGQSSGTAATTPAPVLSNTPNSSNPVIVGVASGTNSTTTMTPRTGYTEAFDNGYATPTAGLETNFRSSGETSATLTQGSTVASAFASIAVELDTSAVPGPGITTFETADWTGTTTPKTITVTGAVTGDLILVMYGGDNFNNRVTAATVSTTGGSTSSWTEIDEDFGPSDNSAWQSAAWATVTADGTVTVSLARTQPTGQVWGGYAILAHNHGGIGNDAHSASSATETVSLTTSQDSAVAVLGIDWDDLANVAFTPAGANDVERVSGTAVAWYAGYWRAQAAGTRSYGIATSSTTSLVLTAIEIKAAASGTNASAGSAAATAAAQAPDRTVSTGSQAATATAAANQPGPSVGGSAGPATSTGAANQTTSRVSTGPSTATSIGTAFNATASTGSSTNAAAGQAAATGTATGATGTVAPGSGSASSSGTALNAGGAIRPTSPTASATGAAQQPGPKVAPTPGAAAATGTALTPSIQTGSFTNAAAGAAAATGTANQPGGKTTTSTTAAAAAGTANQASAGSSVTANAGAATGTGTGFTPTVAVSKRADAGLASASGVVSAHRLGILAAAQAAQALAEAFVVDIVGAVANAESAPAVIARRVAASTATERRSGDPEITSIRTSVNGVSAHARSTPIIN